jgi:hypothetical protein
MLLANGVDDKIRFVILLAIRSERVAVHPKRLRKNGCRPPVFWRLSTLWMVFASVALHRRSPP